MLTQQRAHVRPARYGQAMRPARVAQSSYNRLNVVASAKVAFKLSPPTPVMDKGELTQFPAQPGVYAIYDKNSACQYVGLSRKISQSIATHLTELPDLTHAAKVLVVTSGTREALTDAWKQWVEEAVAEVGDVPPGNAPGDTKWAARSVARAAKPEIKLTAGKAINGKLEDLVDRVVKDCKIVAFVKGTRQQPQCGFSFKMMQMLNEARADYEVVNVLDDVYNPGLREVIKTYSQWPTIPQLYIGGEFVGGADIVEQMAASGELQQMVKKVMQQ